LGVARQQAVRPVIDRVDRGAVGQQRDHRLARGRHLGRRSGNLGAGFGQRLGFARRAIPDGNLVADFHEPRGDVDAHGAQPGYSDFHGSSRIIVAGDDMRSSRGMKAALQL